MFVFVFSMVNNFKFNRFKRFFQINKMTITFQSRFKIFLYFTAISLKKRNKSCTKTSAISKKLIT
jgi:hypothetical protein